MFKSTKGEAWDVLSLSPITLLPHSIGVKKATSSPPLTDKDMHDKALQRFVRHVHEC